VALPHYLTFAVQQSTIAVRMALSIWHPSLTLPVQGLLFMLTHMPLAGLAVAAPFVHY
jgi:hypothetical protein